MCWQIARETAPCWEVTSLVSRGSGIELNFYDCGAHSRNKRSIEL